jgi:hypothetical protein
MNTAAIVWRYVVDEEAQEQGSLQISPVCSPIIVMPPFVRTQLSPCDSPNQVVRYDILCFLSSWSWGIYLCTGVWLVTQYWCPYDTNIEIHTQIHNITSFCAPWNTEVSSCKSVLVYFHIPSKRRFVFKPWLVHVGIVVDRVILSEYLGFSMSVLSYECSILIFHLPRIRCNLSNWGRR